MGLGNTADTIEIADSMKDLGWAAGRANNWLMGRDIPLESADPPYEDDRSALERYIDELRASRNAAEAKRRQQLEWELDHEEIGLIPKLDSQYDGDDSPSDGVVDQMADEFVSGTLKEFAKRVVEIAAEAHGLGPALKIVELTIKAEQWRRVAEGDGALEVSLPIPLGDGLDLELSAHPANGEDGPPLSVCYTPSDGSAVGVVQIGPLEVGPGTEHDRADSQSGNAGEAEHPDGADAGWDPYGLNWRADLGALYRPLDIISADLANEDRVGSRREGLAALTRAAEQELRQLRVRRTRLAVLYDLETGRLLWLRLDADGDSAVPIWRIRIHVDPATGRLTKPDVRQTR